MKRDFSTAAGPQQKLLLILIMLSALLSANAHANRKTDIISMYNGDRITGEIVSLEGGIIKVKTDFMGTLSIEWPEIASVQSDYHYEVRLSDGERMYGSFHDESNQRSIPHLKQFQ